MNQCVERKMRHSGSDSLLYTANSSSPLLNSDSRSSSRSSSGSSSRSGSKYPPNYLIPDEDLPMARLMLRYWYRYGIQFSFASLLVFSLSTYIGFIYAQYAGDFLFGIEVKIRFDKNVQTGDYMLSDPLLNVPWSRIEEDDIPRFVTNEPSHTLMVMESDDIRYDLRLLNNALDALRADHVAKTASRARMTWSNHPRNFQTVDLANGNHARFLGTLAAHKNVVTLLYMMDMADRAAGGDMGPNFPLKEFYDWSASRRFCSDLKDNVRRFPHIEPYCYLHTDRNSSTTAFDAHAKPIDIELILSGSNLKEFPIYVHFVKEGLVDSLGNVYTGSLLIVPKGCNQNLPLGPASDWKIYADNDIEQEVFSISQFYNDDPAGFMLDGLPRIVPFLKFIWDNKHVKVHALDSHQSAAGLRTEEMLAVLGIDQSRLVRGHVKSEMIYVPQGGGCNSPFAFNLQKLAELYHLHIRDSLGLKHDEPRSLILMIRSAKEHKIRGFDEAVAHARESARKHGMEVQIISDDEELTLQHLMVLFYRSAVIFGSRSPLMSNILFSRPGTTIIQILCAVPYITLGHMHAAYSLGQRFHAIPGTIGCASGIVVDMPEIKDALEYFVENMKATYK